VAMVHEVISCRGRDGLAAFALPPWRGPQRWSPLGRRHRFGEFI